MDPRIAELRDSLLALYECARELQVHEIAYHALAGALHAAEELHDFDTLGLVEEESRRHVSLIPPEHRISAQSAAARGHPSMFEQLAALAVAARIRIGAEDRLKQKGRPKAPLAESSDRA